GGRIPPSVCQKPPRRAGRRSDRGNGCYPQGGTLDPQPPPLPRERRGILLMGSAARGTRTKTCRGQRRWPRGRTPFGPTCRGKSWLKKHEFTLLQCRLRAFRTPQLLGLAYTAGRI